jgi:AcrR family transcriptional regulator
MNEDLLAVATAILNERGWSAVSLDAIAERAGVSRATVWRHGLTRSAVELVLRRRLVADYRELLVEAPFADGSDALRPASGALRPGSDALRPGSGGRRLAAALAALCAVAERNLPFLAHTETAFHAPDLEAAELTVDFYGPWLRILDVAVADGSLEPPEQPTAFVAALTNMVLLTYVHLRTYHTGYGWTPQRATAVTVDLVARGYLPRSSTVDS